MTIETGKSELIAAMPELSTTRGDAYARFSAHDIVTIVTCNLVVRKSCRS